MFYCVFVFLLCLSMCTTESTENRDGLYIDGYDTKNAKMIKNGVSYRYKENETLDITCHYRNNKPIMLLSWLLNGKIKNGTEKKKHKNTLSFNINKLNHKDKLTCYASEDETYLSKRDKPLNDETDLILEYDSHKETTSAPINLDTEKIKEETWIQTLLKNNLFLIVVIAVITVVILTTIFTFACIKTYRLKEDKVGLYPAVSNTSVLTTGSRTANIPHHKITQDKVGMHPPVSNASYFTTDSRTLPTPHHKMANDEVGFAVSNTSFFTMDSRKPTSAHKITQARYTNNNYNKTQLHDSREIIDSEYQEPIDSQAYCEPQMYSEPEKQFYAEPIPKILRRAKDGAYVNYNKSNSSANINNENIDLYQNCDDICDNEFYHYSEAS